MTRRSALRSASFISRAATSQEKLPTAVGVLPRLKREYRQRNTAVSLTHKEACHENPHRFTQACTPFDITAGRTHPALLAQPALAVNLAFAPSCNNLADRQAIQNAVNRATTWSHNGFELVRNNEMALRQNAPSVYRDWFGAFNLQRYQRVLAVLDGVRFKLNSDSTMLAHCRVDPAPPCDE
jgi:hypothetical protein